jgi:hypothetical protein
MQKNNNALTELIFTIVLPVIILNKLSGYFGTNGPTIALVIAVLFPVSYFFVNLYKTKKISIVSIFGFLNILLTGTFALFQLNGQWYAIKEMSFPLLIGLGVFYTSFTQKPLIGRFLNNKNFINLELLNEKLGTNNSHKEYNNGLKILTKYLAITFFVSAIINYFLTVAIITELPADLAKDLALQLRNEQIADLTWKSYFVILIPTLAMMSFTLWKTNTLLKDCTKLGFEELTSIKKN